MQLIGKIISGCLEFEAHKLHEFCKKQKDGDVVIKIEPVGDAKSYEQLKFYFGVILPAFIQATGETNKEKLDAYLRDKYLSSVHTVNNEQFKFIPTLQIGKNKVNKATMTKYIEDCLNELIDCGGSIPLNIVEDYREIMAR